MLLEGCYYFSLRPATLTFYFKLLPPAKSFFVKFVQLPARLVASRRWPPALPPGLLIPLTSLLTKRPSRRSASSVLRTYCLGCPRPDPTPPSPPRAAGFGFTFGFGEGEGKKSGSGRNITSSSARMAPLGPPWARVGLGLGLCDVDAAGRQPGGSSAS